ncbi:MAG: hypothetical protein Kow0075_06540 [Salibacteraceae bacterium]
MPAGKDLPHNVKLRILQDLIRIAGSDGEAPPEEFDRLHDVAQMLDVDPMDLERLFTTVEKHPLPKDESARVNLFYELLVMIAIDGEIHPDEIALLKDLTIHMGLSIEAANRAIDHAFMMLPGLPDRSVVFEVFQIHSN